MIALVANSAVVDLVSGQRYMQADTAINAIIDGNINISHCQ
jgi:hypothetical protein